MKKNAVIPKLIQAVPIRLIFRKRGETKEMPWAIPYEMIKFVDIRSSSVSIPYI